MIRRRIARHSADVVIASLLTVVAFESVMRFPGILLAAKLNVFAIPLGVVGAIEFPIWVWYVISLLWASQAVFVLRTDVKTVLRSTSEAIAAVASSGVTRLRDTNPEVEHAESQSE